MRVLSGIQPTGPFHWGNYFGAIKQYIELQHSADKAYYFIANLHALTTVRDRDLLQKYTLDGAIDLLALGLDPRKAVLFVQSDVPEVSELCWLLLTSTPMGLLERAVSFKDKMARGIKPNAGLFTYPVLQAADILAYDADTVPVGEDQLQHIEICRDIAVSFNHHFGETFTMPKAKILDRSARVPGLDGEKMSKSYNNTLAVFDDVKAQRKRIMRIVTSSTPVEEPKDPQGDTLFSLYSLVANEEETNEMAYRYRSGGLGFGEVKRALADKAEQFFAQARDERERLATQTDYVQDILNEGARKAKRKARSVLERAKAACGIPDNRKSPKLIGVQKDENPLDLQSVEESRKELDLENMILELVEKGSKKWRVGWRVQLSNSFVAWLVIENVAIDSLAANTNIQHVKEFRRRANLARKRGLHYWRFHVLNPHAPHLVEIEDGRGSFKSCDLLSNEGRNSFINMLQFVENVDPRDHSSNPWRRKS